MSNEEEDRASVTALASAVAASVFGKASPKPPARVHHLDIAATIIAETPPEYRGAEVSPKLKDTLNGAKASGSSVLLTGPPGTGKTRQLWGMYANLRRAQLERADLAFRQEATADNRSGVVTWTFDDQISIPEAIQVVLRHSGQQPRMRIISEPNDIAFHRFDRPWLDDIASHDGWLAVDDIGFAREADAWALQAIYLIANERRAHRRPTIWTTNFSAGELAGYFTPAVASRLNGGVVLELEGIDRRATP